MFEIKHFCKSPTLQELKTFNRISFTLFPLTWILHLDETFFEKKERTTGRVERRHEPLINEMILPRFAADPFHFVVCTQNVTVKFNAATRSHAVFVFEFSLNLKKALEKREDSHVQFYRKLKVRRFFPASPCFDNDSAAQRVKPFVMWFI